MYEIYRDTILTVFCHYLSTHGSFFEESFKREKLGKSEDVTLGLRVLLRGSLRLKNICKHLG